METNDNQARMNALKQLLNNTKDRAVEYADGLVSIDDYAEIREQRQAWQEELTELEAEYNEESTETIIKKLIALKITNTHNKLDTYLVRNPLSSSARGGKEALYNITKSKQALLSSQALMAQCAIQNGFPYEIKWNAVGERCEEWTLPELMQLGFEIDARIKPLQAKQQDLELFLKAMAKNPETTLEDVKLFEIDYSQI